MKMPTQSRSQSNFQVKIAFLEYIVFLIISQIHIIAMHQILLVHLSLHPNNLLNKIILVFEPRGDEKLL